MVLPYGSFPPSGRLEDAYFGAPIKFTKDFRFGHRHPRRSKRYGRYEYRETSAHNPSLPRALGGITALIPVLCDFPDEVEHAIEAHYRPH
jgi:hypothetical protein